MEGQDHPQSNPDLKIGEEFRNVPEKGEMVNPEHEVPKGGNNDVTAGDIPRNFPTSIFINRSVPFSLGRIR